uniref:Anthocyanidin 3-O-galactosyltransferase 3GT1 n=1 Tax=Rhododendron delavayi TaxID=321363 RepID=F3GT1_RHODL|nr:RecName: Full=Anthocyanidin 3-O-galactosyltransferase 3GT1; AltName: Full=Flavonoid 3-O-glycosyltransferase 1; Short=Rd3GT1; Flags: Precursor [Rhododendron delavayi]
MTKNISRDRHVAVLPFPFSSHAGRLLTLVRRLAAAAPNVTFSFYSTPKSIESLFSPAERVPGNVRPYAVPDGVPEGHVFSGEPVEHVNLYLTAVGEGESLRGVLKAAEAETGRRIGCVMSDAFMWFAGDLAEEMGVPWVPFMAGGANSITAHFYTDLIRETVGMHDIVGRENDIVKFIPGFSELRLGDLPTGVLFGNLESPFAIMLHKMGRALPKATAIAINSFEELDPDIIQDLKSKFKMILNVSPFSAISLPSSPPPPPTSYTDEYGCMPWLDNRKAASVAYIGFGTLATPPPVEIAALAEALEASGTPFLWSLKDNPKEFFPEGFIKRTSERQKIVPWAPQEQVLAHGSVGVFVTHCGWNSALESIAAGVPLIGRPFFGDHQLNAWLVENVWKIGVRVEGGVFTKSGTMSALELVLTHEKQKELRARVEMFKKLALKAVGPEQSSTRNLHTLLEIVAGYNL